MVEGSDKWVQRQDVEDEKQLLASCLKTKVVSYEGTFAFAVVDGVDEVAWQELGSADMAGEVVEADMDMDQPVERVAHPWAW